jgi:hypothetical protein
MRFKCFFIVSFQEACRKTLKERRSGRDRHIACKAAITRLYWRWAPEVITVLKRYTGLANVPQAQPAFPSARGLFPFPSIITHVSCLYHHTIYRQLIIAIVRSSEHF